MTTPRLLASSALVSALFLLPVAALAHETQQLRIGDKEYSFVVGSLGEPVVVDDKSGVSLTVMQLGGGAPAMVHDDGDGDDDAVAGTPVTGLEQTLKVEVSAGDKKKTMDLTPLFGEDGSYKAVFFPTVQTTYTYRFTGTINKVPVDVSFTCNPAGHPQTEEDKTEKKLSDAVTRTLQKGAFGCPLAKADLGFPEPGATIADLAQKADRGASASGIAIAALALAIVGFVLGSNALRKVKNHSHP